MRILSWALLAFLLISCSAPQEPLELNVLSFNIRYDNAGDSLNAWQYRKEVAAKVFTQNDADVVGTQEVLAHQRKDLLLLLPAYQAIGVGREDGKEKGEYSAIFYKHKRFDVVDSGNFWLSETPEAAGSKGWDGACERIATWAIFQEKSSGWQFFFLNTHLDHVGKVARRESIALLKNSISELNRGLPTIVTGDFNASPDSDVIQGFLAGEVFSDTRDLAEAISVEEGTFHNFGNVPPSERKRIDFIFTGENITAKSNKALAEKIDNIYVSDHVPVFATLQLK